MKVKSFLSYLTIALLSSALALGQEDTTEIDSAQLRKEQTETFLRNLVEEATAKVQKTQNSFEDLEIDELIVNSVISKPGNDFFDYFTAGFSWPEIEGNFIILISEKPFRTNLTQILIEVNDLPVFQNVLQPRASYLEELAQYAQEITTTYLLNYQQIILELDGNDRSGSGIY